jgi:hypothetical protein
VEKSREIFIQFAFLSLIIQEKERRRQTQLSLLQRPRLIVFVVSVEQTSPKQFWRRKHNNIVGRKHKREKSSAFEVIAVRYSVNDATIAGNSAAY